MIKSRGSFLLKLKAAIPERSGVDVELGLEAGISGDVHVVVLHQVELVVPLAHVLPPLDPRLQVLELQLRRLEALVARDLGPKLVGAVLERVVADGLLTAVSGKQLQRVRADLLAVVESIVCDSRGRIVDVGPVLVGGSLGELLVDEVFAAERFARGLAAQGQFGVLCRLVQGLAQFSRIADAALVVGLPVLCARLEQVKPVPIGSLSSFFGFDLVVGLGEGAACEIEGGVAAALDVLGVVVLGLSVFEVGLLVDGVVVVVVIERVDLVGLALGRRPDLVLQLQVLALLQRGVWLLRVAFVPAVPDYFVYHGSYTNIIPRFYCCLHQNKLARGGGSPFFVPYFEGNLPWPMASCVDSVRRGMIGDVDGWRIICACRCRGSR